MNHFFRITYITSITILSISCGDDPELIKKRNEQKIEISRLESELIIMNEQLKGIPADRSAQLDELKKELEAQAQHLNNLEQEVIQLEKDKRDALKKYQDYKKKYPISN